MKDKLRLIADNFHRYNADNMCELAFGLDSNTVYDALVVAPSFSPYKLDMHLHCNVTTLREGAYIAGYLVEIDGLKIAWIKIGSSACNLIDHLSLCAELTFKKLIFIGAVGALIPDIKLGDVCTPSYSVSGSYADSYLMKDSIGETMLFEKVYPDEKYIDKVMRSRKRLYSVRLLSPWSILISMR